MAGTIIMATKALERSDVLKCLERREIKQKDTAIPAGAKTATNLNANSNVAKVV